MIHISCLHSHLAIPSHVTPIATQTSPHESNPNQIQSTNTHFQPVWYQWRGVHPLPKTHFAILLPNACVGAHKHQSIRIGVFQCLIWIVMMTLISSGDSVKCRMSRTLLSCLLVAHWPDFRKLLFPDFRISGLLEAQVPGPAFPDWTSII